jgi:hypothetical protein
LLTWPGDTFYLPDGNKARSIGTRVDMLARQRVKLGVAPRALPKRDL